MQNFATGAMTARTLTATDGPRSPSKRLYDCNICNNRGMEFSDDNLNSHLSSGSHKYMTMFYEQGLWPGLKPTSDSPKIYCFLDDRGTMICQLCQSILKDGCELLKHQHQTSHLKLLIDKKLQHQVPVLFACDACNVVLRGHDAYFQHMATPEHRGVVATKRLDGCTNVYSTGSSLMANETTSTVQSIAPALSTLGIHKADAGSLLSAKLNDLIGSGTSSSTLSSAPFVPEDDSDEDCLNLHDEFTRELLTNIVKSLKCAFDIADKSDLLMAAIIKNEQESSVDSMVALERQGNLAKIALACKNRQKSRRISELTVLKHLLRLLEGAAGEKLENETTEPVSLGEQSSVANIAVMVHPVSVETQNPKKSNSAHSSKNATNVEKVKIPHAYRYCNKASKSRSRSRSEERSYGSHSYRPRLQSRGPNDKASHGTSRESPPPPLPPKIESNHNRYTPSPPSKISRQSCQPNNLVMSDITRLKQEGKNLMNTVENSASDQKSKESIRIPDGRTYQMRAHYKTRVIRRKQDQKVTGSVDKSATEVKSEEIQVIDKLKDRKVVEERVDISPDQENINEKEVNIETVASKSSSGQTKEAVETTPLVAGGKSSASVEQAGAASIGQWTPVNHKSVPELSDIVLGKVTEEPKPTGSTLSEKIQKFFGTHICTIYLELLRSFRKELPYSVVTWNEESYKMRETYRKKLISTCRSLLTPQQMQALCIMMDMKLDFLVRRYLPRPPRSPYYDKLKSFMFRTADDSVWVFDPGDNYYRMREELEAIELHLESQKSKDSVNDPSQSTQGTTEDPIVLL